jgi:hypothetical protein
MLASAATPSGYIASTPMLVDLRRIGKGISGHLHNKEAKDPLSKDQTTIITKGECQAEAESCTHANLHTAYFMAVK